MGLETATFISQLNAGNPVSNDPEGQGDDHLRLIKAVLQATFPQASTPFYANVAPVNVASAASPPIGAATSTVVNVTGNATITGFDTVQAGTYRRVRFTGTATLVNSASLILPGGVNIVTQVDDRVGTLSLGGGSWIVMWYQRADGTPLTITDQSIGTTKITDLAITFIKFAAATIATQAQAETGTSANTIMTPLQTRQAIQILEASIAQITAETAGDLLIRADRLQASQRVAKAWGKLTVAGLVLSDAFNIASFTRPGQGNFTVTFTTPMANANYAVLVTLGAGNAVVSQVTGQAVGSFNLNFKDSAFTSNDPLQFFVTVFGDQ